MVWLQASGLGFVLDVFVYHTLSLFLKSIVKLSAWLGVVTMVSCHERVPRPCFVCTTPFRAALAAPLCGRAARMATHRYPCAHEVDLREFAVTCLCMHPPPPFLGSAAVLTLRTGTDHSTLASGMTRALDLGSCAFGGLYTY